LPPAKIPTSQNEAKRQLTGLILRPIENTMKARKPPWRHKEAAGKTQRGVYGEKTGREKIVKMRRTPAEVSPGGGVIPGFAAP